MDLNLSVVAVGTGLTYQWTVDGKNVPGATAPILHLANPSAATAGTYRVVVKSTAGGATISTEAVLRLLSFGDLNFYAGVTLAGTVGQKFRVDYADAVASGPIDWKVLATFTLPFSPYLVVDPLSPGHRERFYRAVPIPLP